MNDAIKVLKKFVKDCNECCADDISYRQPVEDAINKAIIALEQKENDKGWVCDVCGRETASCLSLCLDCNNRNKGALEELNHLKKVSKTNLHYLENIGYKSAQELGMIKNERDNLKVIKNRIKKLGDVEK